jgi:hypothetical protein
VHAFARDRRLRVQNLDSQASRKCITGFEGLLFVFPLGSETRRIFHGKLLELANLLARVSVAVCAGDCVERWFDRGSWCETDQGMLAAEWLVPVPVEQVPIWHVISLKHQQLLRQLVK